MEDIDSPGTSSLRFRLDSFSRKEESLDRLFDANIDRSDTGRRRLLALRRRRYGYALNKWSTSARENAGVRDREKTLHLLRVSVKSNSERPHVRISHEK